MYSDNFSPRILHLTYKISAGKGPCRVTLKYEADVLICDVTQNEIKLCNEELSNLFPSPDKLQFLFFFFLSFGAAALSGPWPPHSRGF